MFKKKDIYILITAVALIAIAWAIVLLIGAKPAGYLEVSVDGKVEGTYPLDKNKTFTIVTPDGAYVHCAIEDGKADVTGASCPDQICVDHRPIKKTGESIVCLPGKVVLTIRGAEDGYDGVAK